MFESTLLLYIAATVSFFSACTWGLMRQLSFGTPESSPFCGNESIQRVLMLLTFALPITLFMLILQFSVAQWSVVGWKASFVELVSGLWIAVFYTTFFMCVSAAVYSEIRFLLTVRDIE